MVAYQGDPAVNDQSNRLKKGSIGSWFSRKFGRRTSEVGSPPNMASDSAEQPAFGKKPVKARDTKSSRSARPEGQTLSPTSERGPIETSSQLYGSAFEPSTSQGLANTLVVPETGHSGSLTPPPQLGGIPSQDSLGVIELPKSSDGHPPQQSSFQTTVPGANINDSSAPQSKGSDPAPLSANTALDHVNSASPASVRSINSAEQLSDSEEGSHGGGDSIGNRTMDTGKSRASTKQTTLMSLDTREPTVLPTTHIAQVRQTDDPRGTSPRLGPSAQRETLASSAIQIASASTSRNPGGLTGTAQAVESPGQHITIPTHSRPHPINNPHPSGIPSDNASVLTLASSTAGMSFAGGATSSRGHYHASSVGGARSIGGSLMGDRRNSSDTYASLQALPPLSRRGSDSSSRTRESVAASATGQNSHQAMYSTSVHTGPGAPSDRLSLHRTPSQKTVATQLSVPLSTSASNAALQAHTKDELGANGSQSHHTLNSATEPVKIQNGTAPVPLAINSDNNADRSADGSTAVSVN